MPPKNRKDIDTGKTREVEVYTRSDAESAVYSGIRAVLVTARQKAYTAVNSAMVGAYWDIGRQIMDAQEGQRCSLSHFAKSRPGFPAECRINTAAPSRPSASVSARIPATYILPGFGTA